jgi:hypothetical protein
VGFRHAWLLALALLLGCGRLGFTLRPAPAAQPRDDAGGMDGGLDAAVEDAGSRPDASSMDASMPDATQHAAPDAAVTRDASDSSDAGTEPPMDDAGPADAGPADAGSTRIDLCSVRVTMNTYIGDPHYHGTFVLQNASTTTWTLPTIEFDLPSSAYVCNDTGALPGPGWTLQSSAGHCTYTKTKPSLSLAPGAMLTFEYSSDNQSSVPEPAAINLRIYGCP